MQAPEVHRAGGPHPSVAAAEGRPCQHAVIVVIIVITVVIVIVMIIIVVMIIVIIVIMAIIDLARSSTEESKGGRARKVEEKCEARGVITALGISAQYSYGHLTILEFHYDFICLD